jgi:hypothetical protein
MGLRGPQRQLGKRIEDKATVRVDEVVNNEPTMPHGLTSNAEAIWLLTVNYLRDDGRLHANQAPSRRRRAGRGERGTPGVPSKGGRAAMYPRAYQRVNACLFQVFGRYGARAISA